MVELLTESQGHVWLPVSTVLWQVLLRFMVVCVGAMIVVRMMGNRTVGQLSPFDLVIMVGIGDIIISGAMDQKPTVVNCLAVLLVLLLLQQLMGYLSLKSTLFRKWFEGVPVVVIKDGKIVEENLWKTQFNYDDLRQELHKQGLEMTSIKDIKIARMESCGAFSVVMQQDAEPLTRRDLEEQLKNVYDNPLSLGGEKWNRIEKLMDDVEYLATYLKGQAQQQQTNQSQQPSSGQSAGFDTGIIAKNYLKKKAPKPR